MGTKKPLDGLWGATVIFAIIGMFWGLILVLCIRGVDGFIPQSWEHVYYVIASAALLIGGLWAFYTWRHNEQIRRFREIPALEMDILFHEQYLPSGLVLLEINIVANNSGVIPIRVCLKGLSIVIEKRPLPATASLLERKSPSHLVFKQVIDREDTEELTLEPMTKTVFTEYFSAEPNTLYAVKFSIPYEGTKWVWDKTRLHFVSEYK